MLVIAAGFLFMAIGFVVSVYFGLKKLGAGVLVLGVLVLFLGMSIRFISQSTKAFHPRLISKLKIVLVGFGILCLGGALDILNIDKVISQLIMFIGILIFAISIILTLVTLKNINWNIGGDS